MLLTDGVPVHVVAERLGHADPAITLQVYAHVIRKRANGVAATFAAVVDGTTPPVASTPEEADDEGSALVAC